MTKIDRFWSKVEKTSSCWIWKGNVGSNGYGQFGYNYKVVSSHRLAYQLTKGEIPEGMELDHLCKNTLCVNPEHLEIVNRRENTLRSSNFAAVNARKTHCIRGHEFTSKNTIVLANRGRSCRTCQNERNKIWMRNYKKPKVLKS